MSDAQPRFIKLTDDAGQHVATRDTQTGLEYADAGSAEYMTPDEAFEAARKLDTLDGGWRPPETADVAPIIDYSRHNPAVDPEFFPWIKADWYWLFNNGGKAAWSSSAAWVVSFYDGGVDGYPRNGGGFALAVRRSGQ